MAFIVRGASRRVIRGIITVIIAGIVTTRQDPYQTTGSSSCDHVSQSYSIHHPIPFPFHPTRPFTAARDVALPNRLATYHFETRA